MSTPLNLAKGRERPTLGADAWDYKSEGCVDGRNEHHIDRSWFGVEC
jgi:hypothetical protein